MYLDYDLKSLKTYQRNTTMVKPKDNYSIQNFLLCISSIAPVALFSLLIGTEDRRRKTETLKYQLVANYILVFFAYWQSRGIKLFIESL
jgi:hypothetical protein